MAVMKAWWTAQMTVEWMVPTTAEMKVERRAGLTAVMKVVLRVGSRVG